MKKKVAILISMIAVSILAGCGSKKETYSTNSEYVDNYIKKVEVDALSAEDFQEPDTGILPKRFENIQGSGIVPEGFEGKEHDNSQFPPEMFWGRWDVVSFNGVETDQIETDVMVKLGDSGKEIACLPNTLSFGGASYNTKIGLAGLAQGDAVYARSEGKTLPIFVYDTSGSTLAIGILQTYPNDANISDSTEAEVICEIDYSFSWTGWELTLAYGDQIATYEPFVVQNDLFGYPQFDGIPLMGYPALDEIENIHLIKPKEEQNAYVRYPITEKSAMNIYNASMIYGTDGSFELKTLPGHTNDGEKLNSLYSGKFYYGDDTLTLVTEDGMHIYTEYADYYKEKLANTVDSDLLDKLNESQMIEMLLQQKRIFNKIDSRFKETGENVNVDEETGRVAINADILFAFDDAALSEDGKSVIDSFLSTYVPIISESQNGYVIEEIVIEGHTDTVGDYDYNLELSELRAKAVADYIMNESVNELSSDMFENFTKMITTEGKSFENPVYNSDGSVNMEASRRVTFRFKMNVGE